MVITTTKILAVSAAVMAAGLVAVVDFAQSRGGVAPADVVAARFPSQAEMLVVLPEAGDAAKTDKDSGCVREHWPYIADECLTRVDGGKAKRPTRTITIERKVASNVSELVRMPVSQVASR